MWKKFLAETEVCKDNMTLRVQQNIFQLNISIDDSQLQQTNGQIPVILQIEIKTHRVLLLLLWPNDLGTSNIMFLSTNFVLS